MIIDDALRAEKPQPGIPLDLTTDDGIVKRALLLMQQNIDVPLSAAEIARRLGATRRQLERHFQRAVGMAPTLAYKIMRLEYAEFLLRNTEQSVTEIATSTGFCDSSHFVRAFKERAARRAVRIPQRLNKPPARAQRRARGAGPHHVERDAGHGPPAKTSSFFTETVTRCTRTSAK